jgi:hypothetical protein
MSDIRQRQERTFKISRILRWVMLPIGLGSLGIGVMNVILGPVRLGISNVIGGILMIAMGIVFFRITRILRQHLAADERPAGD